MTLLSKIMLGIGAAIALVIVIAFLWLSLANAHLKTQLAQAKTGQMACFLANNAFTDIVARQNAAVEQLRRQGEQKEKRAQLALQAAQKQARIYLRDAEKIRAIKISGNECRAARDLVDAYIKSQRPSIP